MYSTPFAGSIVGELQTAAPAGRIIAMPAAVLPISRGASATADQITTIKDYLGKNYGQVNANKAPSKEIVTVLGITPEQADAIVKYRMDHGNFKTIDDLKKVPGLESVNLAGMKDRLAF